MAALLAFGAGCEPPPDDAPAEETGPLPGAWDYTPDLSLDPLDLADVEIAVDEALGTAFLVDGRVVLDVYHLAMAGQDAECPYFYTTGESAYWYDYCTSADGTYFAGIGTLITSDSLDEATQLYTSGEQLQMSGSITLPDGREFDGSGAAEYVQVTNYSDEHYGRVTTRSLINGGFHFEGPEVEGTWLETDLLPDLAISAAYEVTDIGVDRTVLLDGGIGGLDGNASAVVFDNVYLPNNGGTIVCDAEPTGTLQVRDSVGNWYTITYDVEAVLAGELDPSMCDGCGTVSVQGEEVGQACNDFSVLLDWEGAP